MIKFRIVTHGGYEYRTEQIMLNMSGLEVRVNPWEVKSIEVCYC